jgi:hypothetical protein
VLDVRDIEAASGDTGSDQNGAAGSAERTPGIVLAAAQGSQTAKGHNGRSDLQSILTLTLCTVRVYRSAGQALVVEKVVYHITLSLAVDEDQRTLRIARED